MALQIGGAFFRSKSLFQRFLRHAFLQNTSPSGFAAFNRATACIDVTLLLPQVTVPTMVIHEPAFPFGSFELCQEVAAGKGNRLWSGSDCRRIV